MKLKIVSDGTIAGTHILANGTIPIENVAGVYFLADAGKNEVSALIKITNIEIEAEDVSGVEVPVEEAAGIEFKE